MCVYACFSFGIFCVDVQQLLYIEVGDVEMTLNFVSCSGFFYVMQSMGYHSNLCGIIPFFSNEFNML